MRINDYTELKQVYNEENISMVFFVCFLLLLNSVDTGLPLSQVLGIHRESEIHNNMCELDNTYYMLQIITFQYLHP